MTHLGEYDGPRHATVYLVQFVGARSLLEAIEADQATKEALESICQLIEKRRFHILLDMVTGDPHREHDLQLLKDLRSPNQDKRAWAITRTIYAVRCNLFHGHKQFVGVQRELIFPVMIILRKIIDVLHEKLIASD